MESRIVVNAETEYKNKGSRYTPPDVKFWDGRKFKKEDDDKPVKHDFGFAGMQNVFSTEDDVIELDEEKEKLSMESIDYGELQFSNTARFPRYK